MTRLLGGALVLLVLAALTLVLGWLGGSEAMIWVSVASSVGSAVCLALAYHRSRTRPLERTKSS